MRKLLVSFIIVFTILFNLSAVNAAGQNTTALFNTAKLNSGIVTVSCNMAANIKLKVMVEKNSKKITYNLKSDGTAESFPLQMGDGDYKVSVLKNVDGNKYKYVSTENVKLDLTDGKQVYLASIQNINWNNNMAAIKKAAELTKGLKTDSQKISAIYNYLVSNVTYDHTKYSKLSSDYLPSIDNTIASGKGICYDYASTFAAMLRSQGIPAKLVKGYAKKVNGYHAWNEVYNSETGVWEIIDSTYDSQMKEAKTKYSMIKNSGEYTKVYEY